MLVACQAGLEGFLEGVLPDPECCLAGISVEGFGDLGAGIFEDIGSADEFRGDSGGPYPSAACRAVYPRTFWIS